MNASRLIFRIALAAVLCLTAAPAVRAELRFPQPDFQSGYTMPKTVVPPPRALVWEMADVAVLAAALLIAAWLVLKARSRFGVIALTAACLLYFGFIRKGCVCPIGATQNVALGLCDPRFPVPLTVVAFFALPLVAALFFGRVFCAGVCPLGAIQDLVAIKPVRVPPAIAEALGALRYLYLVGAVLIAASGAGFMICRYDPFVAFFRLDGKFPMLVFGAVLLAGGIFFARPYCRFLCPYGVLLGWLSRLSWRHASITPAQCIQCRLCEHSCPFDAINPPAQPASRATVHRGIKALTLLIALLPVFAGLAAWLGYAAATPLAVFHPTVALARQIQRENATPGSMTTQASDAFRASGRGLSELQSEARAIEKRLRPLTALAAAFLGLLFGAKLIALTRRPARIDYETDRALCLSCARCFRFCPVRPGGEVPPEFQHLDARTHD